MECDWWLESEVCSVKDKMDVMGKNLILVSVQCIVCLFNNIIVMLKYFDQYCEVYF